jgi:hypothetical protein
MLDDLRGEFVLRARQMIISWARPVKFVAGYE